MAAEHMIQFTMKIEDSLIGLIESFSSELGMNKSELVRACIRFALNSSVFQKKIHLVLSEGDRLVLETLGDASMTVRSLVRRVARRGDVICDDPTSKMLTIVRLVHPTEVT